MGKFSVKKCEIEGVIEIEPKIFEDDRGYFMEIFNEKDMNDMGIMDKFVQDNQSMSVRGVLRGLHRQMNFPQAKLVRVVRGKVFDVVVDLRENSETYGKWHGTILSDENRRLMYVPEGFAHGFLVLSDVAEFHYKVSDFYHPGDEAGIQWNDPDIGIEWPIEDGVELILSEKDKKWPALKESK